MNNRHIKSIFFVIAIFCVVLFSDFSFSAITDTNQKKISFSSNTLKVNKVQTNILQNSLFSENFIQAADTDDYEKTISNETYAEYHPSLVISENKALIAYETLEGNKNKIYVKTSVDSGQNWSEARYANATFDDITYNTTSPSFTKTSSDYFGAFLTPDNSSYIIELTGSELNNIALWDYTNITSGGEHIGDFYDFKTPDVIRYPTSVIPWIIGVIGKAEFIEEHDEYDCDDSPMFFYRDVDNPSGSRTIVFFPEISGCSNISLCLGKNNVDAPMVYGVCEINNGSNKNLLFFHGNPDIWNSEDLLRKNIISSSKNLLHPKIYAKQNNIYIIAETSSQEIVMYHSNTYGSNGSWISKNVTNDILEPGSKPGYPDIYVTDTHVFCSFIESGNLTVTSSNNSGVNWTIPYIINTVNASVVEQYHYKDMANNHNFVWTDNRNGNFDIYFYVDYISKVDLELVDINLTSDLQPLKTNNLLQITIKNKGDATAKNIKMNVTFSFSKGNDTCADNIFEIEYLLPGETVTISRDIFDFKIPDFLYAFINFAGINNITVKVDPDGLTGDIDTSNNNAKKVFTYEDIFPKLVKFEQIFLLLKEFLFT